MNNTIEYQNIHGNRKYKDSLFRMVFKKKEDLLDLYNAVNGTDYTEPDRRILRLSDAFQTDGGCLECEATMLNINYGQNLELMDKCKRLEEYAIFVSTVRKYADNKSFSLSEAITLAIDECIEKGILADVLTEQRSEMFMYILEAFDKELYERDLRNNIRAEVKEEVRAEVKEEVRDEVKQEVQSECIREKLKSQIKIKLSKGKSVEEIADALEEPVETIKSLIEEM